MDFIEGGYVLTSRKIVDSAIFKDRDLYRLFSYIYIRANHQDKSYPDFTVKRGEIVTSLEQLRNDLEYSEQNSIKKHSRDKIRRMLIKLEKTGKIKQLKDTYGTHISICNYNAYQNPENYKFRGVKTQLEHTPNTVKTEQDTYNNANNGKNEKKDTGALPTSTKFEKPDKLEIAVYIGENNYNVNHNAFYDYYEARGWTLSKGKKMANWKAQVRNWHRNNEKNNKPAKDVWSNL